MTAIICAACHMKIYFMCHGLLWGYIDWFGPLVLVLLLVANELFYY